MDTKLEEVEVRFAGINVPDELVSAHARGQIVFFVGAGASMGAPTNLPSFGELACRIAALCGVDAPTNDQLRAPDVYLGTLDLAADRDVHAMVAQEIARAAERNKMHDVLARLASVSSDARLVTTNYDDMLHSALADLEVEHAIHEAPALPLGNDFEGLVHLHGRLGQPTRRLVITDRDFGSAYITRGWASAFLRDLFSTHVVCFVGYSHDDRMMEYLAKGLPSDAKQRFILTDRNDVDHWRALGIVPICYPEHEHDVAVEILERWGTFARDTPFDRAQRVRSLASTVPPVEPDDIDFLAAALLDDVLAPEVCAIANGVEWVDWMLVQPPFAALVGQPTLREVSDRVRDYFAHWLARSGTVEDSFLAIFGAVARQGSVGSVGPELIDAMIRRIISAAIDDRTRSTWLRWALAVSNAGDRHRQALFVMLWASQVALSESDTHLLLERVLSGWSAPQVGILGGVRESDLDAEDFQLRQGIERRLRGAAADPFALLIWLAGWFEQANRRTSLEQGFDPWSWGRPSVQPHAQNKDGLHAVADVVIDLARDTLGNAMDRGRRRALRTRAAWLESSAPILRRIALDSLARDQRVNPVDRIKAVLRRRWLFDFHVHNEVYLLIARALEDGLPSDDVDRLARSIVQGPEPGADGSSDDPDLRDRQIYELLHWVINHRSMDEPPVQLGEIESRHPEWRPREHPAFHSWSESYSRSIEDEWPWAPDVLHEMIAADVSRAVSDVLATRRREDTLGWWPAGNVLETTVSRWPGDGFALWSATDDVDLRSAVLRGWSTSVLEEGELERVAVMLLDSDLSGLGAAVVRLLRPWTDDAATRERWVGRDAGRELARRVLAEVASEESNVSGSDLYTAAINSSVGTLAEFWIAVAADDVRQDGDRSTGLTVETRNALEGLLVASAHRGLALAPLLLRLGFFVHSDADGLGSTLMKELDPASRAWEEIEPLWKVVLKGSMSEELLDAGVREWLVVIATHAGSQSQLARSTAHVVALVAVWSTMRDDERLEWLHRFVAHADEGLVAAWIHDVARVAGALDGDARTSIWNRWMRDFLIRRTNGVPRAVAAREVSALLGWAALLTGESLHEAVDLILAFGVGLDPATDLWTMSVMEDGTLVEDAEDWTVLLLGLLRTTSALGPFLGRWVTEAIRRLEEAGAPADQLRGIRAELFRLGIGKA